MLEYGIYLEGETIHGKIMKDIGWSMWTLSEMSRYELGYYDISLDFIFF